ncbi:MAG: Mpo1-like protein [Chitinophagales bacterium]
MMPKKIKSLKEFYPFYLSEHQNYICRILHFIGTSLVLSLIIAAIYTQDWKLLAYVPLAGYGFAWIGHFFFEKNKPASFKQPLYSLASDFKMYFDLLFLKIPFDPNENKKA